MIQYINPNDCGEPPNNFIEIQSMQRASAPLFVAEQQTATFMTYTQLGFKAHRYVTCVSKHVNDITSTPSPENRM